MRYTYFKIKNFKGIKEATLDFDKSPRSFIFPLIGLNESGKTTILEAINYFTYGTETLDPLEDQRTLRNDVHKLIPISQLANFNGSIEIEAGIELHDEDRSALRKELRRNDFRMTEVTSRFLIREIYSFKNSRYDPDTSSKRWSIEVKGMLGQQRKERKHTVGSQSIGSTLVGLLKARLPRILYFPNFLFDFPDRIYLEDSEKGSTLDAFYRDVVQDVLDALGIEAKVTEHILERARSGDENDAASLEGLLLDMGRNVTDRVFSAWSNIFQRQISDKEVIFTTDKDPDKGWYVRLRIKDSDGFFSISERSLGFRWFFVFLLLTTYRRERQDRRQSLVFLFDEPASNLHSTAQAELLESFDQLANPNILIYATHSHHLINIDWLESSYVVRNADGDIDEITGRNAKRTDIRLERYREFASHHPNLSSYFQPVLDVLEYRPSQLESVPKTVMVEGKSDFYALRYAAAAIGLDLKDLAILPGGGAGSLDSVMRLYVAWAREFVVLLDSDREGTQQKRRYEEALGILAEGRIYSLGDIRTEWKGLSTERLFTPEERLAIQKTIDPSDERYNKKRFARAIQEALMTGKHVSLGQSTENAFRQIVSHLTAILESRMEGS